MATIIKDGLIPTTGRHQWWDTISQQSKLAIGYRIAKSSLSPPTGTRPETHNASRIPLASDDLNVHLKLKGSASGKVSTSTEDVYGASYAFKEKLDLSPERIQHPVKAGLIPTPKRASEKVEAQKTVAKYTQLRDYLRRVSTGERALVTPDTAGRAMRAWKVLWTASDYSMVFPASCTGPDGEIFYSWDRGKHHLELEIIPDGPAEFFYRDRETERFWGEDYTIGNRLPAAVVEKLSNFR